MQHTHIDVQNGIFVVPEATVSSNYTLPDPTGEDVSLVTEAFKFWLPLFIIGVVAVVAVIGPPFRLNLYSDAVGDSKVGDSGDLDGLTEFTVDSQPSATET